MASTNPINDAPIDPPNIPPAEPTRDIGTHTDPVASLSSIQSRIVRSMLELSKHGLSSLVFLERRQVNDVTASSCPNNNASNDTAVVTVVLLFVSDENAACLMIRRASPSSSSRSSMFASSSSSLSSEAPLLSSSSLFSNPGRRLSSLFVFQLENFHKRILASCPELANNEVDFLLPLLLSPPPPSATKSFNHAKHVIQS